MNQIRIGSMFKDPTAPRKFSPGRVPQLHSTDGYLRVPLKNLPILNWQANYWLTDVADDLYSCGEIEWSAHREAEVLSLGWDWRRDGTQRPHIHVEAGLRTNIWVQDAQGYDLPYQDSQACLLRVIEQLSWQKLVFPGH